MALQSSLWLSVSAQYNGKVETLRDYVKLLCGTLIFHLAPLCFATWELDYLVIGATINICSGAKCSWILVTVLLFIAVVALVVVTSMIPQPLTFLRSTR